MQISVHNLSGEVVDHIEVSERVFGEPFNESVVHQAMVRQRANARQGTASTKTRGEVKGTTKKLFRQKGTGGARGGSVTSPLRRGGGVVFGPKPRSYRQAMPKKMRQLALRCVLSGKVRDEEIIVLEQLDFEQPKTKEMAKILTALGVSSSALIVTAETEENVVKSARNLLKIKTTPANLLNVVDILNHRRLLMTVASVRNAEKLWGEKVSGGESNAPL
ncbi:MAG: 50S ribosomal protein L4 [Dehalococcoidales bacterium]|nr:50S ribosomal protein L4 [Dehalococcoidales bacterium]MDP6127110.1 50S ribosomal protein L4 [Dehalococcoidales bacterium]MDP6501321.1 50S ribosomal protein L4 [Dehalococcoidales bacterium]MDP6632198.1 50S ribosomal protein L4 [Dehalococcoidales bacterium]MDP7524996.1 50S ribosomal protein L4 [Dehalococcoidales bacterium]